MFLSQFNTLASEVKCLRVIERRDLSNERNTFKSKTIFYHKKTRLKPERATRPIPKRRRPLYATATRPIPKRRRPLYATALATTIDYIRIYNLCYNADIESKQSAKRQRYHSRRTVLLKGSDIKRTSRRTALLKYEDNSAAIKASERNRYWSDPAVRLAKRAAERKRYRRGHRTTTTTQRYVMACCIALALKSYRKMCMQHVYSTHVRDLHKTIHFTCKACMVTQLSFVTCLLNIGVSSLI